MTHEQSINLISCAYWAQAAYDPHNSSIAYHTIEDEATDSRVIVVNDKRRSTTIVAFCGTESWRDWLTNFRVRMEPWACGATDVSDIEAHRGMVNAYWSVREQLLTETDRAANDSIIFTGHSLGGGLATLAAADYAVSTCHSVMLVTFGAPRVGGGRFSRFAEYVLPEWTRVTHAADPVPYLPPLHWGYRHGRKATTIGMSGWRSWMRHLCKPQSTVITDHGIGEYIAALDAERRGST